MMSLVMGRRFYAQLFDLSLMPFGRVIDMHATSAKKDTVFKGVSEYFEGPMVWEERQDWHVRYREATEVRMAKEASAPYCSIKLTVFRSDAWICFPVSHSLGR